MQYEDRHAYRLAAAECLEAAQSTAEQGPRERLTVLASKFLDLANIPDSDAIFQALLAEFGRVRVLPLP